MAEALFQEGRKLVEQKRFSEACPKFAESQRLDPGIGTLLNLAVCHELEGRTATAWAEFTQAVGIAERESRADAKQFATSHLAGLTPKLARIMIAVPRESDVPDLEVTLDGQALGRPAWGTAAPIDPGTHVVVAAATGKKRWSTAVTFAAAQQKTVAVPTLEDEPAAPAPVSPVLAATPFESPEPSPRALVSDAVGNTQRTAGLIVGGAGVIAMGAGVVLGLAAKSTYDDASPYCDATGCEPAGLEARSRAVDKGRVATLVFALGAGTAVGGAVLFFTAPHARAPRAAIGVTPSGVVLRTTF
jgi:serine/threonine-protein kinase